MSATMTTGQRRRQCDQLDNSGDKKGARFMDLRERRERKENVNLKLKHETHLFPFKFLTGWVSFYGLVNMEPKPSRKPELLTLRDPHPTRLGIMIRP